MAGEKYEEIVLHLDNIRELFTTPTPDPFVEKTRFISGIHTIKNNIKPASIRAGTKLQVTIFLPQACIEPDLAAKTIAAVRRYCEFQLQQNKHTMAGLRWEALKALQGGILFLACGLFLSGFLTKLTFLPSFFDTLFSSGFQIAVWVILWRPVDFFLFDLWPYWRDDHIYTYMMKMKVLVCAEAE